MKEIEVWGSPPMAIRHSSPTREDCKVQRQRQAQRRRRAWGGGLWLLLQCNTTRPHNEATTRATRKILRTGSYCIATQHANTTTHDARSDNESDLKYTERHSSKFSALGTPAKPPRDVPRNALLCSYSEALSSDRRRDPPLRVELSMGKYTFPLS